MFTSIHTWLPLMVMMIIYIPTICITADLKWFGFRTDDNSGAAGSNGLITMTLWYNLNIYQCAVRPYNQDTNYGCFSNQWTLLGTSECSSPEYKIMIANPSSSDAVHITSLILQDIDNTWWSSDSWCIPDSETDKGYTDSGHWKLDDTSCPLWGVAHGNYEVLCVDNEGKDTSGGCWPQEQIVYFDITRPNEITWAVTWENGAGVSTNPKTCNPTSSPTKSPTAITQSPSNNPTKNPTKTPTQYTMNPIFSPSALTSTPSATPTSPTNIPTLPTNMPTYQPTHCTQDSNAIWTVSFDFTLKKNTSIETIKDNLYDAAREFITTDIASNIYTDCTVATYAIFIDLNDNDLEHAHINASVCFNCINGAILDINITEKQLELHFIETVNHENTVLSVNTVSYITVDVLYQTITTTINYILTTMENIQNSNTVKTKWIGSMDFTESILLMIGLALLLMLIILFLIRLIKRKRKKLQQELNNNMTSINTDKNLVQMASVGTDKHEQPGNLNGGGKGEKQENVQDEDSDDLYSSNDVHVETVTKTKQDALDNDSDSDDMFSTEHVTSVTTVGTLAGTV